MAARVKKYSLEFQQAAVERMKDCTNVAALALDLQVRRKWLYACASSWIHTRLHSSLEYQSPAAYEKHADEKQWFALPPAAWVRSFLRHEEIESTDSSSLCLFTEERR